MLRVVLTACCFVTAANGCSEERKIVDAEPVAREGAAGGPAVATRGGEGAKPAAASSNPGSPAVAGSGSEPTANGEAPAADEPTVADEDNYGWVKFERTPFGQGKTPNDRLRRQIKVTMLGDTTMVGKAYVMRSSLTTSYVDVALAITNSNPELRCFVKAESVVWKTASGELIAGGGHEMTYVSGSVGESSNSPTTTCLGPGEKGYFLEIESTQEGMGSLFDTLAEVELTLASSASSFERPTYRVLPISWEGSKDQLEVTFKNLGAAAAPIELAQAEYILTDGDGAPLTWGFLDATKELSSLGVGQLVMMKSDVYYDGKASNMLVSFGY